ncbi:MAG TPA: copper-binding protein [Thermoanaerobaculia bacterium]|nr:copper-binding protein [Thermoanaerobaculia bacterium]
MKTRAISGTALRPLLLLPLLCLLAAGCSSEGDEASGQHYTVRGQVKQLPDSRNPGTGLYVTHEAIDDWVGRSGEVEGMDSMTMPFPVDADVSLEGIEPNDAIEFELHVDWEADLPIEITSIRELPPGTRLVF